ncbi:MAG: EAL domain-containing protein [Mycobacterium sp.]
MSDHRGELAAALANCESEPIHIPSRIQSHGTLLVVSADLSQIRQVSSNIETMLRVAPGDALGRPLSALVGEANAQKIIDLPVRADLQPSIPTLLQFGDQEKTPDLVAEVHRVHGDWVIELEPSDEAERQHFASVFVSVRNALWDADTELEVTTYCDLVADQVRIITGFDRVMVYQFDQYWNGEVIAESRTSRLPSLLGNHFPSSDIPPQARDLYSRNLFRALADTEAMSADLVPPTHPVTGEVLDMSYATLRSMSPVHIEYLRNMGAQASMSISLITSGKLWGLIACHHSEPRRVSFDVRGLALFIGTTASLKLTNLESSARSNFLARVQEILVSVTRQVGKSADIGEAVEVAAPELLSILRSTGGVVAIDGRLHTFGEVPPAEQLTALIDWLKVECDTEVFHTECLAQHYPEAAAFPESAAGLMIVRMDSEFDNFTLWFRGEVVHTISWAGEPNKSLVRGDNGIRIEPRTSFAQWIEEQHGRSIPWSPVEAESAQALSLMLTEVLTQTAMKSHTASTASRLKYLADHDHLTGLPNRRLLTEKLNAAVANAEVKKRDLAVLFIDLDHFKTINDKLGHLSGDRYLQELARRLRENLRHYDILARWGGDEFVVIIEGVRNPEPTDETIARLHKQLAVPLALDGYEVIPSASIGVARYPSDGTSGVRLMQAADQAMYRAKKSRPKALVLTPRDPDTRSGRSIDVGSQLRRAVAEHELVLHYQPQFRTECGSLAGLEALLRWNHPTQGLIAPPASLPDADGEDVMRTIADWVLRSVCAQLAEWKPTMPPSAVIAINIGSAEFDMDLAGRAADCAGTAGISTANIAFEMTEETLERRSNAVPVLQRCADTGIKLTVDDFGTGYMSLGQLRELPISSFKIDQQFVDGALRDERDAAIIRSVVAMCNSLGIESAAQGVSCREQLDFLRAEHVDVVQGPYLGDPMPESQIAYLLAGTPR